MFCEPALFNFAHSVVKSSKMSAKAELAKRVLQIFANGNRVPERDALQLRNWAIHPGDAMLTLREIALRVLREEEGQNRA
jgi:hypothetical protein